VRARAGGLGHTVDLAVGDDGDLVGEAVDGVGLLGRHARSGRWETLASAGAGLDSPAELELGVPEAADAASLLVARDGQLHFLVRAAHGSGNGPQAGAVALGYLELAVRYRCQSQGSSGTATSSP